MDELVARVAADADFYRNSGGGVTFSGGEPLAQPDFLLAALERCRAIGIHTAVETCGYAPRDRLAAVEPLVDLFLYDLKLADPVRHRALTGVGNADILANLRFLAARAGDKVVVRVPIVPGFTDDLPNLEAIAALTRELGIDRVELCPYHPLGRAKYAELGRPDPPDPASSTAAELARIAAVLGARGEE